MGGADVTKKVEVLDGLTTLKLDNFKGGTTDFLGAD